MVSPAVHLKPTKSYKNESRISYQQDLKCHDPWTLLANQRRCLWCYVETNLIVRFYQGSAYTRAPLMVYQLKFNELNNRKMGKEIGKGLEKN